MRASGFAEDSDWCSSLKPSNPAVHTIVQKIFIKILIIFCVRLTKISASYAKHDVDY